MNLADIRRKAQQDEAAAQAAAALGPYLAAFRQQPEQPEQFVQESAPQPAPQDSPLEVALPDVVPEVRGELVLPVLWDQEPDGFDPAALIIKGRESAQDEEVSHREEQGAEALELLCFRVAHEEYALSIMDIKEIIKPREVTEVPRVPSFIRGILSLRGIIIPIFDMRVRLGLADSDSSSPRERIIVVKRPSGFCGVLVDEVVQVVRVPEGGIEPPPVVLEGIDRDFVKGIGRVSDRMLILLDMEKVLDVSLF